MLTIPTYISKSKIHGMGVFTPVFVPKNTSIWEFHPDVDQKFTEHEFYEMCKHLSSDNDKKIKSCSSYENGVWILCGDNAKFFNHDEINPSVKDERGSLFSITTRDLNPGDELTCNYKDNLVIGNLYDETEDLPDCEQCGEPAWDGYICHACGMKHI